MKKIIALLLLFAMTVTVCGCQDGVVDVRGKYEENPTNTHSDISNETDSSTEEFSLGKVAGNVYKSDFIGIGYNLDENWSFYDDAKIKELNQMAYDMAGEEFEEIIKNATLVYDMMAVDGDQLNNVNINLEKIDTAQLLLLDIAENFEKVVPITINALKNMGYENINYEIINIEVDGKTLDALRITSEINGTNAYQTAFQKKCNGYLATMTVTTYFNDTVSDLIDNFYWLK